MKGGVKGIKSVKVPKSIDLDFKKKKIKVGRKVKKNNITKIKIQSKNINMPSQNIDKSIVDHDEQITLEKFKKHLSHHSPHVRQSALTSIKVILKSGSNNHIQSYIAIIFPPMMELLFDVEKSVRQTLLEVMSDLFHYFPLNSFTSIDSVVATYLCSGLTNLVKAIRKDSVRLLLSLLNSHTTYLSLQYTEVILAHLLNILSETVKSTSQDTSILNVNVTEASESTSKKAPDSFLLVLLQSIHLCTKSSVWYSGNKKTSDSNEAIDRDLHTQQQHSIGHFHNQARVRVHRISSLLSIRGADSATTGQPESDGHSIYSQVCLRLYSLWAYTLSAQSVLTQGVISVLTEVAYSLEELANLSSISGSADFTSFLDTLLRQFPYKTNTNATTSISHGSRKAEGLNLLICQLVFQALSSQDINAQQSNRSLSALREMNLFVVEDLTHFVQLVSRSDAPQQSIEEIETHDEEVETVVQARPSVPGRGGRGIGIRKTTTSTHSSNTKRLFECVHCVIRLGVQLKQPIESEIESILALLAQLVDRSKGASKVSALVIDTVAVTALEIIPFLEHCLSSADSNHAHDVAVGMIKVATSLIRIAPTLSDESSLQLLVSRIARMLRSVFSSLSMAGEGIDSFAALQLQALHDLFKLIFTNFQTISTEMQSQVVDLFYYCPLQGNLVAEAVKLGAFVCSSAVDVTVQTHFVRLLTERRHEVSPNEFLSAILGIVEGHVEFAASAGMIIPYTHSTTLFVKLGEAMLKCSSSDVPWKMLNFTNPMISALLSGNTMKCESGLLRAYAALYLQTSLLMPWRSVTSIPSIVLEEVCSQENHKSEHNALVAFLLSLLLSFDTILQQAAFRDVDSTLFVIPALRLRIFLPSSVLATLNFAKLSNSAGVSILEMVLADTLNRITETDRLSRTLGFLERLLQEQGGICKVTEMEKDSIVSFIKVVKSDHRGDDKVSSLCNEILGHSD